MKEGSPGPLLSAPLSVITLSFVSEVSQHKGMTQCGAKKSAEELLHKTFLLVRGC